MDHVKVRLSDSIEFRRGRGIEIGCTYCSNHDDLYKIHWREILRQAIPRHHCGCRWEPSRYNVPHNF